MSQYEEDTMALDSSTISAIAAGISGFAAVCAMVSAGVNIYSSRNFYRQLTTSSIDACACAALALKSEVHKVVDYKEDQDKDARITSQFIWDAYDETWKTWVSFTQAYIVALRYNPKLDRNAPDDLSRLLWGLRVKLRKDKWLPEYDIRQQVDTIIKGVEKDLGLTFHV
jgi:hypothetical protein